MRPSTHAKNDDSFYLPPEVFGNPDFKRGLKMFVSPDGKAVRLIISHHGDPVTPKAFRISIRSGTLPFEAMKGTPLGDAKIYLAGSAATYKDLRTAPNTTC